MVSSGALPLVVIEPAPALAAEQPGVAQLAQQWRVYVTGTAELIVKRLEDGQARVQADQVEQGQRPHGQAESHSGRPVDVLPRGLRRFQQVHRVVEVGHEQRVHDEPGPVSDPHRSLAQVTGQQGQCLGDLRRGEDRGDHLDQLHHRGRIEEVQPRHPGRIPRAACDLRDRQGGGIGSQDRIGPAGLVQLSEQGPLELDAFRNGLYHQVGVGHSGRDIVGGPDPGEYLVPRRIGKLPPADRPVQGGMQPGHALVQEALADLDRVDRAAAAGDQLGDARAHQAEPDHRHLADVARLDHAAGHVP